MTAKLNEVVEYLDQLLDPEKFPGDSSNNGLQVEGAPTVEKALFAVDSPTALLDRAAACRADLVFVHHGLSWGTGFKMLTGITAGKLRRLFSGNISLYASHLPLDAHPVHGHNAVMADMIDLCDRGGFYRCGGNDIGISGRLPLATTLGDLAELLADRLNGDYTIYGNEAAMVANLGLISGSPGSDGILAAGQSGLDCLITGEITHVSFQTIRETGLPVICLGHYKSETPGVVRMMELVNARFDIDCEFVDLPTGL